MEKIYPMTAELLDKGEENDGIIFKDLLENEEEWAKLTDKEQLERMAKLVGGN